MDRNSFRSQKVSQEKALNPRLFRGYARRIVAPRLAALHAEIRAEVNAKIEPESLEEVELPAYRFRGSNKRKTDGKAAKSGQCAHFYTVSGKDDGEDLSAANSLGFALLGRN